MCYPGYQRFSLARGRMLRGRPQADESSAEGRSFVEHCRDLTETGNRAVKVSSTQGTNVLNQETRFMTSNLPKLSASVM